MLATESASCVGTKHQSELGRGHKSSRCRRSNTVVARLFNHEFAVSVFLCAATRPKEVIESHNAGSAWYGRRWVSTVLNFRSKVSVAAADDSGVFTHGFPGLKNP